MRRNPLVPLGLAVVVALATFGSFVASVHTYCEDRPRMVVLATLAAFLIALCFRQLSVAKTNAHRWLLAVSLAIAGLSLFANASLVVHYNRLCGQMEQDIRNQLKPGK